MWIISIFCLIHTKFSRIFCVSYSVSTVPETTTSVPPQSSATKSGLTILENTGIFLFSHFIFRKRLLNLIQWRGIWPAKNETSWSRRVQFYRGSSPGTPGGRIPQVLPRWVEGVGLAIPVKSGWHPVQAGVPLMHFAQLGTQNGAQSSTGTDTERYVLISKINSAWCNILFM